MVQHRSDQPADQVAHDVMQHFGPDGRVTIELDFMRAMSLIGTLQLALRHPTLPAQIATHAHEIIGVIKEQIAVTDAIAELIELGFDPNADVPANEGQRCMYCGCSEFNACPDDGTGHPCHWVAANVCSNPSCVAKWVNDGAGEEIYSAPHREQQS
ncbi:hypothetical protein HED60_15155 [Planctomycetales bacterium ZRK34]|nr:hypothetical protein HED60_15155 [Planctomycetales bacterium ZRK34]